MTVLRTIVFYQVVVIRSARLHHQQLDVVSGEEAGRLARQHVAIEVATERALIERNERMQSMLTGHR